jgi:hypothetical protein
LINIKRIIESELQFDSDFNKARFKAIQQRESGAWLHAFPSKNIGTCLDKQDFQTSVGLRLGCRLFENHICSRCSMPNETGFHGLSCVKSLGRIPRHNKPLNPMVYLVMMARDQTEQPLFRGQRVNVLYGTLLVLIP